MYYSRINKCVTNLKRLEVKITNSDAMSLIKCHYLASMTNVTFMRMIKEATLTVIIEYKTLFHFSISTFFTLLTYRFLLCREDTAIQFKKHI